jgi:hypothetical protein
MDGSVAAADIVLLTGVSSPKLMAGSVGVLFVTPLCVRAVNGAEYHV